MFFIHFLFYNSSTILCTARPTVQFFCTSSVTEIDTMVHKTKMAKCFAPKFRGLSFMVEDQIPCVFSSRELLPLAAKGPRYTLML